MKLATRLLLIPLGLLLAVLSFAHATSVTERLAFPPGIFGRSAIDSHVVGELVDRYFKVEMTALHTRSVAEQGGFSAEELASLAEDPVALRRFLEGRQGATGPVAGSEYPRISGDLLRLARLSYSSDPLNVRTLCTIALGRILHEDPDRARQLLRLAAKISKRDDVTNLWLAQDYGKQGNIEQMLASFDHALRTSRRARERAMGVVVRLLDSHDSHEILGNLLRQHPDWQDAFWAEFSHNPAALSNAAAFFENSGIPFGQMPESRRAALYANLKRAGSYDTLFALAVLDPAVRASYQDARRSGFDAANKANPLGWTFYSRGTFSASFHRSSDELQIDASAGAFGVAADQVVRGGRDLEMTLRMAEPVPRSAAVKLSAVCVDGQKRKLAEVSLPPEGKDGVAAVRAQECNFVNLELSFKVDQGRRNPLIRIAAIEIESR